MWLTVYGARVPVSRSYCGPTIYDNVFFFFSSFEVELVIDDT